MKNAFALNTRSNKDNFATAAIIVIGLFALASGVFASRPAAATQAVEVAIQTLEPIVVTASRVPDATLDTMVVTASRKFADA